MAAQCKADEASAQPMAAVMPPDYLESLTTNTNNPSEMVPLKDLARWPRVVECPACHSIEATRIVHRIGTGTQYVSLNSPSSEYHVSYTILHRSAGDVPLHWSWGAFAVFCQDR